MWTDAGSLYYRAPESFQGCYGCEVDTWAAGIIAFELATGKVPFKSAFHKKTQKKIMKEELDLSELNMSE